MKRTLIVPLVTNGNSKVFEYNQFDCIINCVDAVSSLEISKFDEIYFILNKQVAQPWRLEEKISADVTRLNHIHFSFIILPSMTDSPAETIYKALSCLSSLVHMHTHENAYREVHQKESLITFV